MAIPTVIKQGMFLNFPALLEVGFNQPNLFHKIWSDYGLFVQMPSQKMPEWLWFVSSNAIPKNAGNSLKNCFYTTLGVVVI